MAKERQDAKEASDPRSNLQLVHALMTHVSGKPDVMGPMVARIKELFEEVANTKPKAVCDDALLSPAHTKTGGRGGRAGARGERAPVFAHFHVALRRAQRQWLAVCCDLVCRKHRAHALWCGARALVPRRRPQRLVRSNRLAPLVGCCCARGMGLCHTQSPEKGQGNSAPRSARREGADKLAAL